VIRLDVTSTSSVEQAIQRVLDHANALHVLVNNAGYALMGGLEETSIEEAQQQFDTNFFGVVRMTQAVLPAMRGQRFGRIVNISSAWVFFPGLISVSMLRRSTRWKVIPRLSITKFANSAFAPCSSNRASRRPASGPTEGKRVPNWTSTRMQDDE
jgi:NAD(P)-dependent dehydrogenase (short-subunit alcohol dehydrogenase family)